LDGDGKRQVGHIRVSGSLRTGEVLLVHLDSVSFEPFRRRHERGPMPLAEGRIPDEAMD